MAKVNNDIKIIVDELVRSGKLNKLVSPYVLSNCIDEQIELKKDFIQDLAIILLEYKKPDVIIRLYARDELDYFILGIIRNQLISTNSKYYYQYGKWETNRSAIDEIKALDT